MIWLLLIYPLVGVGIWIDLGRKYGKLKYYGSWVDGFDLVMLPLIWPVLARSFYGHYNEAVRDEDRERTEEHERLIERIRKEPDPQLADWDREFNELAGIEEDVPELTWESAINDSWEYKGFQHYDKPLNLYRDEPLTKGGTRMLAPNESIYWYPPQHFSQGGFIPTTTELNDTVEFRVREHGSHFSL